jgi:hypothetical protein
MGKGKGKKEEGRREQDWGEEERGGARGEDRRERGGQDWGERRSPPYSMRLCGLFGAGI